MSDLKASFFRRFLNMGTSITTYSHGISKKGTCFVEWTYKHSFLVNECKTFKFIYSGWKHMTIKRAIKEKRKIIMCQIEGCDHHAEVILQYLFFDLHLCMKHLTDYKK